MKYKGEDVVTKDFTFGVVQRSEDRLTGLIEVLKGEFSQKLDRIISHLDGLAKEFKKFDEERVVLSGRQRNHEDRLEKLEKTIFKTP